MRALVDACIQFSSSCVTRITHCSRVMFLCTALPSVSCVYVSSLHSPEDPTNVTLKDFKRYIHQFPQSELKTALHFSILDIDTHEPFT